MRFRLPAGADQEAVSALDAAAEMTLLARCTTGRDAGDLSAEQRETLIAEMERQAPCVDLELDLTCPDCGHRFLLPFDTTAFFFEELRSKKRTASARSTHAGFLLSLERGRRSGVGTPAQARIPADTRRILKAGVSEERLGAAELFETTVMQRLWRSDNQRRRARAAPVGCSVGSQSPPRRHNRLRRNRRIPRSSEFNSPAPMDFNYPPRPASAPGAAQLGNRPDAPKSLASEPRLRIPHRQDLRRRGQRRKGRSNPRSQSSQCRRDAARATAYGSDANSSSPKRCAGPPPPPADGRRDASRRRKSACALRIRQPWNPPWRRLNSPLPVPWNCLAAPAAAPLRHPQRIAHPGHQDSPKFETAAAQCRPAAVGAACARGPLAAGGCRCFAASGPHQYRTIDRTSA